MKSNIIYENSTTQPIGEFLTPKYKFTIECYTAVIEHSIKFLFWTFYRYEVVQTYNHPNLEQRKANGSVIDNLLFKERSAAEFFLDKWKIQNKHYDVKEEWFKPNTKTDDNTSKKANSNQDGCSEVQDITC